jgi:hypothetical protein
VYEPFAGTVDVPPFELYVIGKAIPVHCAKTVIFDGGEYPEPLSPNSVPPVDAVYQPENV